MNKIAIIVMATILVLVCGGIEVRIFFTSQPDIETTENGDNLLENMEWKLTVILERIKDR